MGEISAKSVEIRSFWRQKNKSPLRDYKRFLDGWNPSRGKT